MMVNIVSVAAITLGFPAWATVGIIALISALIGFIVLSAVIKWRML